MVGWERVKGAGGRRGAAEGGYPPPQPQGTWSPLPIAGVDFKMKTIEVDGLKVRIQIW